MQQNIPPLQTQEHINQRLVSEILTYLAGYPAMIQHSEATLGDLALDLGKCITWIHGLLEPSGQKLCTVNETPQSLYSLGTLLQDVGRLQLEREKLQGRAERERTTQGRLDRIEHEIRQFYAWKENLFASGTQAAGLSQEALQNLHGGAR